jgi:peptide-methionine (S)-S-oxide reductase|tara:strand:- start:624 stop:1067 length:444 start_codon:yes stop_codon:yes gene_type:complete
MEIAILGLGCFWEPEIKFSKLDGIIKTEVGYCGGNNKETTYKEVCSGSTNHAEVVKLKFDPKLISYENILNFFFQIHDPTTLNSQGPDFGTQYRSEIFYLNENQKKISEKVIEKVNKKLSNKIVTNISLVKNYCPAEEYHQRYLEKR